MRANRGVTTPVARAERRFSEFCNLHHQLVKNRTARPPPLPNKTLLPNQKDLENRRVAFENFLNIVLADSTLSELDIVKTFIGIVKQKKDEEFESNNNCYDSFDEEEPLTTTTMMMRESDGRNSLEDFYQSSSALHKTIAESPSPLRFSSSLNETETTKTNKDIHHPSSSSVPKGGDQVELVEQTLVPVEENNVVTEREASGNVSRPSHSDELCKFSFDGVGARE